MIKPQLTRKHLEAFSVLLLDDVLNPDRHPVADEMRSRLVIYLTIAFYLYVEEQPITVATVAERARFNPRTVNLGFKYLADNEYLIATLTIARHGRGRAYEYSFSPRFVRRVLQTRDSIAIAAGGPAAKRARA